MLASNLSWGGKLLYLHSRWLRITLYDEAFRYTALVSFRIQNRCQLAKNMYWLLLNLKFAYFDFDNDNDNDNKNTFIAKAVQKTHLEIQYMILAHNNIIIFIAIVL